MESVEAIVRDWEPQPLARVPVAAFQRWKRSLEEHIHAIEAARSAHHRRGVRLKNMLTLRTNALPSLTLTVPRWLSKPAGSSGLS